MLQSFSQWKCCSSSFLLRTLTPRKAWPNASQYRPGNLSFKATYISVATLNPELFDFLNQSISDISGLRHTKVHIHVAQEEVLRTKLFYMVADEEAVFPQGTRGYLYFKGHQRYPLIAGSLRFRVLPEGCREFEEGDDLMMPDGTPWQRVLSKVQDSIPVLIDKLVEERLLLRNYWELRQTMRLSETLAHENEPKPETRGKKKLPPPKVIRHTNPMYNKDDTFTVDLSTSHGTVSIFEPTSKTFRSLLLWYIFRDRRKPYQLVRKMRHGLGPYEGLVSGRFELSTLPEHQAEGGHVVVRIQDILNPVKLLVDEYDGYIHPPIPGELLSRGVRGRSHPWSILLDESERGRVLRKLFFGGK